MIVEINWSKIRAFSLSDYDDVTDTSLLFLVGHLTGAGGHLTAVGGRLTTAVSNLVPELQQALREPTWPVDVHRVATTIQNVDAPTVAQPRPQQLSA